MSTGSALGSRTRAALLRSARRQFATHAYADVTLRSVAADAGVSPPLVLKYFGTKDALYREAADFADQFDALLDSPDRHLGRYLVAGMLEMHHAESSPFLALVFMASRVGAPEEVRHGLRHQFVDRLAARLTGPDAAVRAELVAAQLVGLAAMVRVLQSPGLSAARDEDLVAIMGPILQSFITP